MRPLTVPSFTALAVLFPDCQKQQDVTLPLNVRLDVKIFCNLAKNAQKKIKTNKMSYNKFS